MCVCVCGGGGGGGYSAFARECKCFSRKHNTLERECKYFVIERNISQYNLILLQENANGSRKNAIVLL